MLFWTKAPAKFIHLSSNVYIWKQSHSFIVRTSFLQSKIKSTISESPFFVKVHVSGIFTELCTVAVSYLAEEADVETKRLGIP